MQVEIDKVIQLIEKMDFVNIDGNTAKALIVIELKELKNKKRK